MLELLECRIVPTTTFSPDYLVLSKGGATPFDTYGPTGTTPAQIKQAYGINQISFNNGTVAGDGTGETIAIVDAYDDPSIANDLQQFDAAYGLPNPTFTKVNQSGGSALPSASHSWSPEIALDVEWAHAIAPKANILLVEASNSSETNLFAAVQYAAAQSGVVAVSMSWGGTEFAGESSYDSTFLTPAGHAGVTFVVASGDSGAPPQYPATSPNVLAVGGTTLDLTASGSIISESGWSGSGGGLSSQEAQPSYQKGVVSQSSTMRANPDVAYDADPNTGFGIYDSYDDGTLTPWAQYGGTSDAAPQWAALIAIADQGRADGGLGSLNGATQTLPDLYALPASDFNDITTGSSEGSPSYSAAAGYDLVTGRGTPIANEIVAGLVGQPGTPAATHFSVTTVSSSVAGSSFSVVVTALNASGTTVTGYTGTVAFTSSDPLAGLPSNYTFVSSNDGTQTFTVTLKTAGAETITATDTSNSGISGSATVTVSPAAAAALVFGQQPTNAAPGAVISPAIAVRVVDAYGNLVTTDNTDSVTLALGTNAGNGTLSGTTTETVSGGVATFSNLSINNVGTGYTLNATSGTLTNVTSTSFNIATSSPTLIQGFETSSTWYVVGGRMTDYISSAAAHDGNYGLVNANGNDWIYQATPAVTVKAGDTLSVWLQFAGSANGRAYFAFGATATGTLSLVAAPNTGQFIIQSNVGYGFTDLVDVNQTYQANHWYRLEVDWGTSGTIVGKLFDSNGTTLLNTASAKTTAIMSGSIGFRATGSNKYWDTVTDTPGVNSFIVRASLAEESGGFTASLVQAPVSTGLGVTVASVIGSTSQTNPTPIEQTLATQAAALEQFLAATTKAASETTSSRFGGWAITPAAGAELWDPFV